MESFDNGLRDNEKDPTLPDFQYSQEEREKMLKQGMSEQEINEKEARIRLDRVENKFKQELDAANEDLPEDEQIQIAA